MRWLIVIGILLLGTVTRLGQWHADLRFYADEALFARVARDAAVMGDWLISAPIDKPPLAIWAMALSMQAVGVTADANGVLDLPIRAGEMAARLPAVLFGVLTIAALMAGAHALAGFPAAAWTGLLAAGSPTLIAFSATALTDPPMLLFLSLTLWMALTGRGGWTGLWLAAAFASKQQAVLLIPLVAGVLFLRVPRGARLRAGLRALTVLALGVALLLVWDSSRGVPSIFSVAADNNNPYRLIVPLSEWGGRLSQWLGLLSGALGVAGWGILGAALAGLALGRRTIPRVVWWLLAYAILYLAAHVLLPFNVYDRYVLPLLIPVLIVCGVGLARLIPTRWRALAAAALAASLILTPPSLPLTERDTDGQILELADFVNQQGLGTIVYNRWLGWEMSYYLGAWSDKRVVYYPTAEALASDAPLNPDTAPRLLIAPDWADSTPWLTAVEQAGFRVELAYNSEDYAAWWLTSAVQTGE